MRMNYAMSTNLTGECMRRATIPCDTLQNYRFFILTSFIFNLPMQAAYFYLLLPVGILSLIKKYFNFKQLPIQPLFFHGFS